MKELSVNKLENLEGGKFWGKTCTTYTILGKCYENCKIQRFWIVTRRTWGVPCGTS